MDAVIYENRISYLAATRAVDLGTLVLCLEIGHAMTTL